MQAILQYLQRAGYGCVPASYYARIDLWRQWYEGYVSRFHRYRQYNGRKKLERVRMSLGMGKTIAEDWANLALNEKVDIVVDDEDADRRLHDVLESNNFRVRANALVELAFALGTGAFVEHMDGDDVKLDYIRAGMIFPLAWDNGEITECAFASERIRGKDRLVYLNIHRLEGGRYVVENHMFKRDGDILTETPLPEDVEPVVRTGSDVPRFQIVKPNIVNNIDPDIPLGISVFANATDQLKGLDLVYDSYCNEFRLGKKRITVPMSLARKTMEEDGTVTPVFDDNDTEFYAVPEIDGGGQKIEEHNMELRYEAHEAGIQTALNLLAYKCGMGKDRYNFDSGSVKTATEVISEKSELYQNLKKHELLLDSALRGLVRAVLTMLGIAFDGEITINFDDSIIEDSASQREVARQDVRDGILTKWEYRMRYYGEDEDTAKSMVAEAGSGESGPGLEFMNA